MKTRIVSSNDFISGKMFHDAACEHRTRGRHQYRATLEGGRTIVVTDASGQRVKVNFAGASDNRTLYADIDGVGFIGGWQYPHKAMPWRALVDSINRGILYPSIDSLPKTHRVKTCPHCGGEL